MSESYNVSQRIRPYRLILILSFLFSVLPKIHSFPTSRVSGNELPSSPSAPSPAPSPNETQRTTYFMISIILVLLGGVFAGLTLGLMGQDEVYLKVISTSGSSKERVLAKRVLSLMSRGKHWLLVTLLLSNVITNETLPIVLDRCLGGGWQAVFSSTVLIVIFGEIIPQSICVKFGLEVGAFFAPFVLVLMYVMFPVAYPIALLLDYMLGEDHGTMYKKSGLKTLVTLHRTMGVERLTHDEVTIISAVLDLKEKKVKEIMTPIENVFTMSADRTLDEKTVEEIFNSGFSRIPIFLPNEPRNFIGMLLVRILISYDPEDCLPVSHFPLATLPETSPNTSCLNILNYFQEGKSHMCVVSEEPGSSLGAIGVLTLEDVIEELIGEEIVDESDVFVDIHQRIMREQPGPLSKRHITSYLHHLYTNSNKQNSHSSTTAENNNSNTGLPSPDNHENSLIHALAITDSPNDQPSQQDRNSQQLSHKILSSSPPLQGNDIHNQMVIPSNLASNPLDVKKAFVTIKKPNNTNQIPNKLSTYGSTKKSQSMSQEISKSERQLVKEHLQASKKAMDITQKTGQPMQVTTSKNPDLHQDKDKDQHQDQDKDRDEDQVQAHRDSQNVMISSSFKSTKNGIVESIITVKGVPKTIIEPANNWDENSRLLNRDDERSISKSIHHTNSGSTSGTPPPALSRNASRSNKSNNSSNTISHENNTSVKS